MLQQFQVEIYKYTITINIDVKPDLYIIFNKSYFENIVYQLVDNAIKFRKETTPLQLDIQLAELPKYYELTIKDNGQGFDMDMHKSNIFKMYATFHVHENARGIGLYLIKNQIEALNGTITVWSKENEGTIFKINIPKHYDS